MAERKDSARTFFRIVAANPPNEADFRSHQELGRPLFDPKKAEEWRGISVYGTLHQARKKARQYPSLGRYVAEMRIVPVAGISFKRTGHTHSHYTLQGQRTEMVRCVVAVWPVWDKEEQTNGRRL